MPNDLVQRLDATWLEIEQSLAAYLSRQEVSEHDAQDIINETYDRIRTRNLPADIDELEAYAITVARNLLKQRLKQGSRFVDIEGENIMDEALVSDIDAHHVLERAYDGDRVMGAAIEEFDQLTEREKFSLIAHLNNESTKAIAAEVGCDRRTVQRYIKKGVELISRALKRPRGDRDEK